MPISLAGDRHRAGQQEREDLDPAERAVGQQARVVVGDAEPVPGQSLDDDGGLEDDPCRQAVAQQRLGDPLSGSAGLGSGGDGRGGHDGSSFSSGADHLADLPLPTPRTSDARLDRSGEISQ